MGDARCGSGNPGSPPGSRSCLGHRHRPRSGGHCPRSVRAVGEIRRVFVQTGIFRDVRTWHLLGTDPDAAEPLSVARTPDGERRSVHEVSDPSGRRLVIVVTDTVASGWAEADVARVLRQWASHGPVALLNVLPRRLWDRGAVRPRSLPLRAVGPASPTTSWRVGAPVRSHRRSVRLRPTSHVLAIPVVEAEPASVLLLAKLVAGAGQWTRVPCLVIPRTPSPPAPLRAESLAPAREEVTDTLSRFRAGASPLAQQLAAYLSAVPLSLPVMNLVRRTMLPEAEHGHLAEVALSGLFTPWAQEAAADPDRIPFDFRPGVRAALLGGQRRDAVTSVQQLVRRETGTGISEYGAPSGGDFLVGRGSGDGSGDRGLAPEAMPFAAREGAAGAAAATAGAGRPGLDPLAGAAARARTRGPLRGRTGAAGSGWRAGRTRLVLTAAGHRGVGEDDGHRSGGGRPAERLDVVDSAVTGRTGRCEGTAASSDSRGRARPPLLPAGVRPSVAHDDERLHRSDVRAEPPAGAGRTQTRGLPGAAIRQLGGSPGLHPCSRPRQPDTGVLADRGVERPRARPRRSSLRPAPAPGGAGHPTPGTPGRDVAPPAGSGDTGVSIPPLRPGRSSAQLARGSAGIRLRSGARPRSSNGRLVQQTLPLRAQRLRGMGRPTRPPGRLPTRRTLAGAGPLRRRGLPRCPGPDRSGARTARGVPAAPEHSGIPRRHLLPRVPDPDRSR
ncbi:SAV_2336 N-terminal domain-related protein [Streptomyces sp. NPDC091416]|uniref:SAV_2336 N-terminal domain-related protein n=1 Tax=Streptomyces sp. NPDC091416 TaxID=3366003 RepID=UPI00380699A4